MLRRSVGTLAVLAFVLALGSAAFAQSVAVAQLSGAVTDESGGVLPGASVTVTQTSTGLTRSAVTGLKGDYVFINLPIGPYRLTVTMPSFRSFEQTGINLNVGDTRSVNIALAIGAMSEVVTVQADASLVQTRTLSVGQVTTPETIVGLPLDGRSATQLLLLEGGAVEAGATAGDRGFPGQVAIVVAGGTSGTTQYLVDGGYNNDPQTNSGSVIPFPDALAEFRTESGVRDARYGMSTGATVNAVTKSGTNQFHGNAFNFMRDHRFNAIRFFEKKENGGLGRDDGLRRNQFGGTFGGPIKHDKLFVFVGIQATITDISPLVANVFVPTAEMLRGDFTRVMSAACRGGTARTLGAPFVNNKIDPALYDPISLKVVAMMPVADPAVDPDGCGRYVVAQPNNSKDQQYVSRVDYELTPNKRVFFRDFFAYDKHPAAFDKTRPNLLDSTGTGTGTRARLHATVAAPSPGGRLPAIWGAGVWTHAIAVIVEKVHAKITSRGCIGRPFESELRALRRNMGIPP